MTVALMSTTPSTPQQGHDRRQYLLSKDNTAWKGIDYIEIVPTRALIPVKLSVAARPTLELLVPTQTLLRVHFLSTVPVVSAADAAGLTVAISGGETIPTVAVVPGSLSWSADADARPLLSLHVAAPGDFSTYTLAIAGSTALDPYFDNHPLASKRTAQASSTARHRRRPARTELPSPCQSTTSPRTSPGSPGALGLLGAPLPGLGGALRGGPRRDDDGGAQRPRRRAQLLPGPGRGRGFDHDRNPARLAGAARPPGRL